MVDPIQFASSIASQSPTQVVGGPSESPRQSFKQTLLETRDGAESSEVNQTESAVEAFLEDLSRGEAEIERVIQRGLSRRTLRPQQLLSMQALVYRYSQQLSVATKLTEAVTNGVKMLTSIQV